MLYPTELRAGTAPKVHFSSVAASAGLQCRAMRRLVAAAALAFAGVLAVLPAATQTEQRDPKAVAAAEQERSAMGGKGWEAAR